NALQSLNPQNVPLTSFASRTDKGVHALVNTFHAELVHSISGEVFQPHFITRRLNSYLKDNNHEILVAKTCVVPDTFHARHDAKWRSYIYRLAVLKPEINAKFSLNGSYEEYLPVSEVNRCHVVPSELNTNVVQDVTSLFCGAHNFTTFTKRTKQEPWRDTNRVIDECKFYESSNHRLLDDVRYSNIHMWEFYIKSRAFLYHQIRKLVGTALSAGFGLLSVSDVEFMLKKPNPNGWRKSKLVPSCGLYLSNVAYNREGYLSNQHSELALLAVVLWIQVHISEKAWMFLNVHCLCGMGALKIHS
ncbi:tRNA pseudouridine synthase-like 1, partial [Stegodyphus dumicola]|uniref:tRNA pseudouridine synthase-like 1 n=1 Tax=Stegodyphus dumicola TaxID=202533 RepID=UPI0015AF71D7